MLERVNSHVEITVEDSGIGIRPDFLPHVFDRFRQYDATTTRRYGGLGLGLSIVKSLVELHGGSVRVKSPGENMGSTFVIALPVSSVHSEDEARMRHPAAPDPLEAIALPRLDDVSVLIVDDEADGRMLVARILEGRGARVTAASSAAQALELMCRQRFDVFLSDIGMPDMDGYELMRRSACSSRPTERRFLPSPSRHMRAVRIASARCSPDITCIWRSRSRHANSSPASQVSCG